MKNKLIYIAPLIFGLMLIYLSFNSYWLNSYYEIKEKHKREIDLKDDEINWLKMDNSNKDSRLITCEQEFLRRNYEKESKPTLLALPKRKMESIPVSELPNPCRISDGKCFVCLISNGKTCNGFWQ